MHRKFLFIEDMFRSYQKLLDFASELMGQEREGSRADGAPEADPGPACERAAGSREELAGSDGETGGSGGEMAGSGEELVSEAARRLSAFLAEAARGREEALLRPLGGELAALDPTASEAREVRPVRPWRRAGRSLDLEAPEIAGEAGEPLSLAEFPPMASWHQALILPPEKWGAGAWQVIRWLKAKTAQSSSPSWSPQAAPRSPLPALPSDAEGI